MNNKNKVKLIVGIAVSIVFTIIKLNPIISTIIIDVGSIILVIVGYLILFAILSYTLELVTKGIKYLIKLWGTPDE